MRRRVWILYSNGECDVFMSGSLERVAVHNKLRD